jgi:membrane carboxypeptidase/penicillin-binding protein
MIRKGEHNVTADWEPRNSDNKYRGMVTLKKALANKSTFFLHSDLLSFLRFVA